MSINDVRNTERSKTPIAPLEEISENCRYQGEEAVLPAKGITNRETDDHDFLDA